MAELIRLQKFMADCGVASRRACEVMISEGRVKVDGKTVKVQGIKIDPINTKVEVDNELISQKKTKTYLAFHKPQGVLSTMSDPEGRASLGDFFGVWPDRLFHVGRLDKDSEGLIILTNDGQWAHESTHPSFGVEKTYLVQTEEPISREAFQALVNGVELDDGLARPLSVARHGAMIEVVIHEGRNQIVRRMFDALGFPVERLIRTAIGSIKLGELPSGKWRSLNNTELINR
jgi:23S rRNA pseudouridine2605 synthase